MNQILLNITNIEYPLCSNYDCQNRLTEYEFEKLKNVRGFSRYHYCRKCRYLFGFGKIPSNKCRDCGIKIDSAKIVCKYCRLGNKNGLQYVDRKCAYRNCKKIISKEISPRQKYCSKSHRNSELQIQYRERKNVS